MRIADLDPAGYVVHLQQEIARLRNRLDIKQQLLTIRAGDLRRLELKIQRLEAQIARRIPAGVEGRS